MTSRDQGLPELDGPPDGVATDALFDILSESRRRFVLACLHEYATPIPLADVGDELATWEHEAPLTEVPEDDVAAIYMSLYHVHVPKMADAGLVEYSQEQDLVTLTDAGEQLSTLGTLPTIE